jgi:hypothetical protein
MLFFFRHSVRPLSLDCLLSQDLVDVDAAMQHYTRPMLLRGVIQLLPTLGLALLPPVWHAAAFARPYGGIIVCRAFTDGPCLVDAGAQYNCFF